MRRFIWVCLLLIITSLAASASQHPIVLLFTVSPGEGADAALTFEATQAIKMYLRETGKADVADFDPESPLVKRALMEHLVSPEELESITTPAARLRMGKLVNTEYVATGDLTIVEGRLTASIWIAETRTEKIWRNEASVIIYAGADGNYRRSTSNAIQSAISSVIHQIKDEVFKNVGTTEPVTQPTVTNQVTTSTDPVVAPVSGSVDPAAATQTYIAKAEKYVKEGAVANAISEYRNAINLDPTNMGLRLRLVQLYAERKMFTQAIDEINRALTIEPENELLKKELARIHETSGEPEKAAEVYKKQAEQNPDDLDSRLRAAEYYVRNNNAEEAEKQFRLAIEIDPRNPIPHEKLAFFLAGQTLFNESRKELDQLSVLDPTPTQQTITDRYSRFRPLADRELNFQITQIDSGLQSFENKQITRESFYYIVRGVSVRVGSVSNYLQGLIPPENNAGTHRLKILGCSLLSQACTHLLRYLETNKTQDKEDAAMFLAEARKHLNAE
ncbi:MAG TPA: tetratricopeptide repeat protein [Armatimonadota bacterium]|nr:tetratricopeptide repeat protein [Armatimonadota bacterium]HOM71089.1 tetratricopeptide repeat protein [Armatimonadota bacterium]HPP76296.1 tetratricopeptide repeat protein [Armatimonadota bacterium]